MPKTLATALLCVLLISAGAAGASEGTALRFRFNRGDVYQYSFEVDGVGEMSMKTPESMAMDMESFDLPMDMALYTELEVHVMDVDKDNNADMQVFMNRFRMNTGPGGAIDSSNEDEDLPPFIEALFDDPVTLKVAPSGKVLDARLPPAVADAGDMDEMMQMFLPADLDFAEMLSQSLFTLPDKPVKPGDTWSQTATVPVPMSDNKTIKLVFNFKMEQNEQVKGLDCAVLHLTISDDFSKQLSDMNMPFAGDEEIVTMHFDKLLMDFDGKLYFAPQEGVFVGAEGTLEQDVAGSMTGSGVDEVVGFGLSFQADVTVQLQ